MQTPAMGLQLALFYGFPALDFLVGAAAFPGQSRLAVFLNAALFIIVVRISRPVLSVHLALEPMDFPLIRG
jgi:hypothetical protein